MATAGSGLRCLGRVALDPAAVVIAMASPHTSAQRAIANLPIALIPTGYVNAGAGFRLHPNVGRERCQDFDVGSWSL